MKPYPPLKVWQDKADLNKRFPGYFIKPIFRLGLLISFFFFILISFGARENFFSGYVSVACPADSGAGCSNTYAVCLKGSLDERRGLVCPSSDRLNSLCSKHGNLCESKYLRPGEVAGSVAPWAVRNAWTITLMPLILAFIVNHVFYSVSRIWRTRHR